MRANCAVTGLLRYLPAFRDPKESLKTSLLRGNRRSAIRGGLLAPPNSLLRTGSFSDVRRMSRVLKALCPNFPRPKAERLVESARPRPFPRIFSRRQNVSPLLGGSPKNCVTLRNRASTKARRPAGRDTPSSEMAAKEKVGVPLSTGAPGQFGRPCSVGAG